MNLKTQSSRLFPISELSRHVVFNSPSKVSTSFVKMFEQTCQQFDVFFIIDGVGIRLTVILHFTHVTLKGKTYGFHHRPGRVSDDPVFAPEVHDL